jgi:hypothetical protein
MEFTVPGTRCDYKAEVSYSQIVVSVGKDFERDIRMFYGKPPSVPFDLKYSSSLLPGFTVVVVEKQK